MVWKLLVKQGSNLDDASCLLCGSLCCSFSLLLINTIKEKERMAVSGNCCASAYRAVLHS